MPHRDEWTGPRSAERTAVHSSTATAGTTDVAVASDHLFRLAMRSAGIGMCLTGPNGTFLEVNPALCTYLGRAEVDLKARTWQELTHPEDLQVDLGLVGQVIAGQIDGYRLSKRFLRPDGTVVSGDMTVTGIRSGSGQLSYFIAQIVDVTAQVAAVRALAASEEQFRLLAENASDVVYQTDPAGKLVWVSAAVQEELGWEPEELLGLPAVDLIHPDQQEEVRFNRRAFLAGAHVDVHPLKFRTRAGDYRTMLVRARPLFADAGSPAGAIVGLRDITTETAIAEELAYLATHDSLTGQPNRTWILSVLKAELRAAALTRHEVGVLFIDLDNFKVVNDSLGHIAGDEVLVTVAHRISAAMGPNDRFGRFGGDEFIVVTAPVESKEALQSLAQRISLAISEDLMLQSRQLAPTASIGIAVSDKNSTDVSLLRDTDSALFRAKSAGRSRWQFFDERMHAEAIARINIEAELRIGLRDREFVVHYQPIVDLASRAVVGHEALVRWNHPTRGLLPPGDFLPVAEASGLIIEIGDQVLQEVCILLRRGRADMGTVSVNMSAIQLADSGWCDRFLDTLAAGMVEPARVTIELTETAILQVLDETRADIQRCRDLGMGIHVDDFGTGFSSLSLLQKVPATGLKLDISFTRDLTTDNRARVVASALANLATGLGVDGVAEGIESTEQMSILIDQGWRYGQGYLFGRPSPRPVSVV